MRDSEVTATTPRGGHDTARRRRHYQTGLLYSDITRTAGAPDISP
ncbi:hypothetical protein [Haloferax sp. YSSS75]